MAVSASGPRGAKPNYLDPNFVPSNHRERRERAKALEEAKIQALEDEAYEYEAEDETDATDDATKKTKTRKVLRVKDNAKHLEVLRLRNARAEADEKRQRTLGVQAIVAGSAKLTEEGELEWKRLTIKDRVARARRERGERGPGTEMIDFYVEANKMYDREKERRAKESEEREKKETETAEGEEKGKKETAKVEEEGKKEEKK